MATGRHLIVFVWLFTLVVCCFSTNARAESAAGEYGDLAVKVSGINGVTGKICAEVFASKEGFPSKSDKALKRACVVVKGSSAVVRFSKLPYGAYAVFAFHDEDSDGKVRKNWIGMPKEGVGASNQAGGMGGPSFKDARFEIAKPIETIRFKLKYL